MQEIDEQLRETEVKARKDFLIRQLESLDIYQAMDGRKLDSLTLYTLEWMYAEHKSKAARAYGE